MGSVPMRVVHLRQCALVLSVPLLAFLLPVLACSGAAKQLVDELPEGTAAASGVDAGAVSPAEPTGSSGGQAGSSAAGFDAGAAPDQCPAGATLQTAESGDHEETATPFDATACGSISPGQSYWWTFTLPAAALKFGISFHGNVQIEGACNGTTFGVTPGATYPFAPGAAYDLRVSSTGSKSEPYVIVVTEL
jgi:hypothetical protein